MLNIVYHQFNIPTVPQRISTSGILFRRLRAYVVSPPVERWAEPYMNLFKPRTSRIHEQVDVYLAKRLETYQMAARRDREYLLMFLNVSRAKSVCEITREEIRQYAEKLREMYRYDLYTQMAMTSLRNFIRFYRAQGYPTLQPHEIRE